MTGEKMHKTIQFHPKPCAYTRGRRKPGRGGMRTWNMAPGAVNIFTSQGHSALALMKDHKGRVWIGADFSDGTDSWGACYALRTPLRRGRKIRSRCANARRAKLRWQKVVRALESELTFQPIDWFLRSPIEAKMTMEAAERLNHPHCEPKKEQDGGERRLGLKMPPLAQGAADSFDLLRAMWRNLWGGK